MPTAIDALGRQIRVPGAPRRIVSVVPSLTELLYQLDLDEQVVGVTRYCVHPPGWLERKTLVGGTKRVDLAAVRELRPDLVLANREENTERDVQALGELAPVFVTDVHDAAGALDMIRAVGRLVDRAGPAVELALRIEVALAAVPAFEPLRACYLIWNEPFMTVGRGTFIHDVMARAGLVNVFGDRTRYPAVSAPEILAAGTEVLLLSSEPFPFDERHRQQLGDVLDGLPSRLVDGELFSWYGSRMLGLPAYLVELRAELAPG